MFVDRVKLKLIAGDGGDGMIAFRREKYVDKGGPSGGDGGRGGSIYFMADLGLNTLIDFKFTHRIVAKSGGKGQIKLMTGQSAEDVIVKVPLGTAIYNELDHSLVADVKEPGVKYLVVKGGRGGRGNAKFTSSTNQVPRVAENGTPGEEMDVILELKLLADVGLVGYPSVGKSTLLTAVSNATPEIAPYHFTTLIPHLGVVRVGEGESFVMADLPGLIKGASEGKGLGLQFLRHIERCRVLVHVVDMSSFENRDPYQDFLDINEELRKYGFRLLERPMIIAANKMDDEASELFLEEFKQKLQGKYEIFPISAITKQGVDKLIYRLNELVKITPEFPLLDENEDKQEVVYNLKGDTEDFHITRFDEKTWIIHGEKIERFYKRTNIKTDEGLMYFVRTLRRMGVEDELRKMGIKDGDTVKILDFEFEYYD
jgi:GTP-binding protein